MGSIADDVRRRLTSSHEWAVVFAAKESEIQNVRQLLAGAEADILELRQTLINEQDFHAADLQKMRKQYDQRWEEKCRSREKEVERTVRLESSGKIAELEKQLSQERTAKCQQCATLTQEVANLKKKLEKTSEKPPPLKRRKHSSSETAVEIEQISVVTNVTCPSEENLEKTDSRQLILADERSVTPQAVVAPAKRCPKRRAKKENHEEVKNMAEMPVEKRYLQNTAKNGIRVQLDCAALVANLFGSVEPPLSTSTPMASPVETESAEQQKSSPKRKKTVADIMADVIPPTLLSPIHSPEMPDVSNSPGNLTIECFEDRIQSDMTNGATVQIEENLEALAGVGSHLSNSSGIVEDVVNESEPAEPHVQLPTNVVMEVDQSGEEDFFPHLELILSEPNSPAEAVVAPEEMNDEDFNDSEEDNCGSEPDVVFSSMAQGQVPSVVQQTFVSSLVSTGNGNVSVEESQMEVPNPDGAETERPEESQREELPVVSSGMGNEEVAECPAKKPEDSDELERLSPHLKLVLSDSDDSSLSSFSSEADSACKTVAPPEPHVNILLPPEFKVMAAITHCAVAQQAANMRSSSHTQPVTKRNWVPPAGSKGKRVVKKDVKKEEAPVDVDVDDLDLGSSSSEDFQAARRGTRGGKRFKQLKVKIQRASRKSPRFLKFQEGFGLRTGKPVGPK